MSNSMHLVSDCTSVTCTDHFCTTSGLAHSEPTTGKDVGRNSQSVQDRSLAESGLRGVPHVGHCAVHLPKLGGQAGVHFEYLPEGFPLFCRQTRLGRGKLGLGVAHDSDGLPARRERLCGEGGPGTASRRCVKGWRSSIPGNRGYGEKTLEQRRLGGVGLGYSIIFGVAAFGPAVAFKIARTGRNGSRGMPRSRGLRAGRFPGGARVLGATVLKSVSETPPPGQHSYFESQLVHLRCRTFSWSCRANLQARSGSAAPLRDGGGRNADRPRAPSGYRTTVTLWLALCTEPSGPKKRYRST